MSKHRLFRYMKKYGDRQEDVAAALGISRTTLSKKMNGNFCFTQSEIATIKRRYHLTPEQLVEIFFS